MRFKSEREKFLMKVIADVQNSIRHLRHSSKCTLNKYYHKDMLLNIARQELWSIRQGKTQWN